MAQILTVTRMQITGRDVFKDRKGKWGDAELTRLHQEEQEVPAKRFAPKNHTTHRSNNSQSLLAVLVHFPHVRAELDSF